MTCNKEFEPEDDRSPAASEKRRKSEGDELGGDELSGSGGSSTTPTIVDDWEESEKIYDQYAKSIYGFFFNKLTSRSRDDVGDLVHETFVRFIQRRSRGPIVDKHGKPFKSAGAYLHGVALYVLKEHLRETTKSSKLDELDEQMKRPLAETTLQREEREQRLERKERRSLLHERLRQIPFHCQMVIECCYFQDMTYREVAELLDVPIGTVATWCRRGRDLLRELYEQP